MNYSMVCPYCKQEVHPQRLSRLYRCGMCGKVFRAPAGNNIHIQQLLASRAQLWTEEVVLWQLEGLIIPDSFILEVKARVERNTY